MTLQTTALKISPLLCCLVLGACATPQASKAPAGPKPGTVRRVSSSDGGIILQAEAVPGKCYQLQRTSSLVGSKWEDVGQPIVAEKSVLVFSDTSATNESAFYRIKPLD